VKRITPVISSVRFDAVDLGPHGTSIVQNRPISGSRAALSIRVALGQCRRGPDVLGGATLGKSSQIVDRAIRCPAMM